jgi:hypothetical protein
MFRKVFLLACTGGGVYGAIHLLTNFSSQMGVDNFSISGEGVLLAIPIAMLGAGVGAFLGSLLYPSHR